MPLSFEFKFLRLAKCAAPALCFSALIAAATLPLSSCKGDASGLKGESATMLSYLPSESVVVIGASWTRMQKSELFAKYKDQMLDQTMPDLAEIKEKCGIDLLAQLKSAAISMTDLEDEDSYVAALKGDFDRAKIEECYTEQGGTVEDGRYQGLGDDMNVYWASPSTVVFSTSKSAAELEQNKREGGISGNSKMMKLVSKIKSNSTIWATGLIPSKAKGPLAQLEQLGAAPPTGGHFSLIAGSDIMLHIGMEFANAKEATSFGQIVSVGIIAAKSGDKPPGMAKLLNQVQTDTSGKSVTLRGRFSEEQIKNVINFGRGF